MNKYLTYLRVAILCWKQERVLEECFYECEILKCFGEGHKCNHINLYNEYEGKISQLINEKNLHSN